LKSKFKSPLKESPLIAGTNSCDLSFDAKNELRERQILTSPSATWWRITQFPELLPPGFLVQRKKDEEAKSPSTNKNPSSTVDKLSAESVGRLDGLASIDVVRGMCL
jgi:hypothetical protein